MLGGRAAEKEGLREEKGLPEAEKRLADLVTSISSQSGQISEFDDETVLGQERMRIDSGALGGTKQSFGAQARERNLQRAVARTGRAAALRADIASASFLQNNITAAQKQIKGALDVKYDALEREFELEKVFLGRAWDKADTAERSVIEAKANVIEQQQESIDNAKRLVELAAVSGASPEEVSEMFQQDTPAGQTSSALSAINRLSREDRAAEKLSKNLANALKQEQLNSLREPAQSTRETKVIEQDGRNMLIDMQTGEEIASFGTDEVSSDQLQNYKNANFVNTMDSIKDHPGLNSSVGPLGVARFAVGDAFGNKDSFIGSTEEILKKLTLNTFAEAKEKGMTFGAMSQGEWDILGESASKIVNWREKNKRGDVVGYDIDQKSFLKEMDVLSNFAKMDAIRKGTHPEDIGVVITEDGKMWTEQSDGSMEEITINIK
jgi:hypothetical protein